MTTETLTQPDFTRCIRDRLEAATDAESLLKASSDLVRMRHYSGVMEFGIPHFKSQMKKFWPEYKSKCVVAVDLDNIVHMSWAVQPNNMEHTLTMLRNIYKATSPDVFMLCKDLHSSKKQTVADYKADRSPKPPEFYEMYAAVTQALESKGIQVAQAEGYEADDLMAAVAQRCQWLEMECVLVGTDKDIFQCLGPGTAIYNPTTKEFRNTDWLKGKWRVTPAQWIDWTCMVGGKNNVEGCPGIGEKGASDLLEAWGDIPTIYDNKEKLNKKQREGMEAFYPRYWDIRDSHTLRKEVEVSWKCNSAA
jgi:5'-3' exonuclease